MLRSDEERVNIVIGEAILALLEGDDEVSVRTLARQLKKMLEVETEVVRREVIKEAIRQTSRLLTTALQSGNCCAEIKSLLREFPRRQSIRQC